jgi:hypothetical protein
VNIQWARTDQRWYLGVRCRKCHSPILFAVDHSEGVQGRQTPPPATLVLTCTIDKCKYKADYTGAVVLRLQKSPADVKETIRSTTSGKSGKRKV